MEVGRGRPGRGRRPRAGETALSREDGGVIVVVSGSAIGEGAGDGGRRRAALRGPERGLADSAAIARTFTVLCPNVTT